MDLIAFTSSLKTQNYAARTIVAYGREVESFRTYLRQRKLRVTQVSPRIVLEYLNAHVDPRQLCRSSIRRRLAALTIYFDFLALNLGWNKENPVRAIRRPKRQAPNPKPGAPEDIDRLLEVIDNDRDKAIVRLFLSTGLRLAELASLDRDSIQIELLEQFGGTRLLGIGTVMGKGAREREFLVDPEALTALISYLKARGKDDIPALFLSNRDRRISARALQYLIHNWSIKAGITPIHPHQLRHSFSTGLHRAGVDLLTISQLLGHSSIETTRLYIQPDLSRIRAEYYAAMGGGVDNAGEKPSGL